MSLTKFVEKLDHTQTLEEILDKLDKPGAKDIVLSALYAVLKDHNEGPDKDDKPTAEDLGPFARFVESWE